MQDLKVTITNLMGAVVYDVYIKSPNSIERITLRDVPSGMYSISLKGKDVNSSFKKFKR